MTLQRRCSLHHCCPARASPRETPAGLAVGRLKGVRGQAGHGVPDAGLGAIAVVHIKVKQCHLPDPCTVKQSPYLAGWATPRFYCQAFKQHCHALSVQAM